MNNLEKICKKWLETGLLENSHDINGLALCLEAQLLFNNTHELPSRFKLVSIPLVRRIFEASKATRRNNFLSYFEDARWPTLLHFKNKFTLPEHVDLERDAEWCANYASAFAKELDEAFADKNNMEVVFRGLGCMDDGTVIMYYS